MIMKTTLLFASCVLFLGSVSPARAQDFANTVECKYSALNDHYHSKLTIRYSVPLNDKGAFEGTFEYSSDYQGEHSPADQQAGTVTGEASYNAHGISGYFDFSLFGKREHVEIQDSIGHWGQLECIASE